MIDGKYTLEVRCQAGLKCPNGGPAIDYFEGHNLRHAHAEARMAGWLFKNNDVLCPECAKQHRHEPRYPGGRRL